MMANKVPFPVMVDDKPMLDLALVVNLFFRDGFRQERRRQVLACFNRYIELCGDQLRYAGLIIGDAKGRRLRYQPNFASIAADKILADTGSIVQCKVLGGDQLEVATPYFCYFVLNAQWEQEQQHAQDILRFTLPWNFFSTGSSTFPELFTWFAATLQPEHGFGGLGFALADDLYRRRLMEPLVYRLAVQAPFLIIENGYFEARHLSHGIREGNFLTALSDRWAGKLGGSAAIEAALVPGFTLRRYAGGLTIQAGDEPNPYGPSIYQPGKLTVRDESDDTLKISPLTLPPQADAAALYPLYRRLNKVLKPIRVTPENYQTRLQSNPEAGGEPIFDRARSHQWLARFDE
jgi:hypothetical protein